MRMVRCRVAVPCLALASSGMLMVLEACSLFDPVSPGYTGGSKDAEAEADVVPAPTIMARGVTAVGPQQYASRTLEVPRPAEVNEGDLLLGIVVVSNVAETFRPASDWFQYNAAVAHCSGTNTSTHTVFYLSKVVAAND